MAILLDTHTFLWWCADSKELSKKARAAIATQDCLVSMATFWEMAIKLSLRKLRLPVAMGRFIPEQMQANGFEELGITLRQVVRCASLPWHHRDPFDRLLVAQALDEGIAIVSRDAVFQHYGVTRLW